ncbi:MAG: amino acid permease [Caulobacterales bacterium]
MAEADGVKYSSKEQGYFEKRELKRHAGVWSLWALGVGAVISGQFSGWNLGFAVGGWGGLAIASIIIAIMYLGLTFSIAEMSPALPHTGAAYSFARTTMGPWGGFITGLCENVEYVLTPAVVVFFMGSYLGGIFETDASFQPVWWILGYILFVILNVYGVALSFGVTLFVTFLALAVLAFFYIAALPHIDFATWALNIAPDGSAIDGGHGPLLPMGVHGILACLPFAVWLFLAIEQLPLAAEESTDPKKDMPKGILYGMVTLIISAVFLLILNPAIKGVGSHALGTSGEPILDGFRAIFGDASFAGIPIAKILSLFAVVGLVASFHTIIFAKGRQIFSLSRAGYFPTRLSVTHPKHKTPHVAMIAGSLLALVIMLALFYGLGADKGGAAIGGTLLNMAVFGAMCSYVMQAVSFLLLRKNHKHIDRPYKSPFGVAGAWLTIVIAIVTMLFQLTDPIYQKAVFWVAAWIILGAVYFAAVGRNRLILSPEEEFALEHKEKAAKLS